MMEVSVSDEVLQVLAPGTRWLSTGWNGGFREADAAYNISVPTGWDRTDLTEYIRERRSEAGFDAEGPALMTGVTMKHAVGARLEPVWAIATVGLSNPASLPLDPADDDGDAVDSSAASGSPITRGDAAEQGPEVGTVNVLLGTERALEDASLATLLGVVVEAKTATLQQLTGFTGTTSDAVIVGSDPTGTRRRFAGSSTEVGRAARAAVRDAVRESMRSRYEDTDAIPSSVADADSGVETTEWATVFRP